jgi:hypothetical protein
MDGADYVRGPNARILLRRYKREAAHPVERGTVALFLGAYMLWHGNGNPDQGWYLLAGHRVYNGALPYRDFAFFQGPLSVYVYGIPSLLGRRGVMAGETVSTAMTLVTLGVAMRIAYVHGGRLAAVLVPLLLLNALTLQTLTTVRTEPISTMLLVLVAYFLLEQELTPRRAALASLAALLAVLARLSMLPMFLLVVGLGMYRFRSDQRVLAAYVVGIASAIVLCVAAVAVLGPGDVWFDLVLSQAQRDSQLVAVEPLNVQEFLRLKCVALLSVELQFPVAFAAGLAGCAWLGVAAWRWLRRRTVVGAGVSPLLVLFGLAAASYLPQLAPRHTYDLYFVPSAAVIAIAVAIVVGRWRASLANVTPAVIAVIALIFLQVLSFSTGDALYTRGSDTDGERLRTVARVVHDVTPSGRQVITLDLAVALEAHREVPDEFSMGIFAYYPRLSDNAARHHGVVNERLFRALLERHDVSTVVLSDLVLGIMFERHWGGLEPNRVLSEAELQRLIPELSQFRLTFTGPPLARGFGGPTYVLTRR